MDQNFGDGSIASLCQYGLRRVRLRRSVPTADGSIKGIFPEETPSGHLERLVARVFFGDLAELLERIVPARRRLEADDEVLLLRYCVVLAALDRFFREGFRPDSLLLTPAPKTSVAELLAVAQPEWLNDLLQLSWGFFDIFSDLLDQRALLNPTFDGSEWVGGADADLIVENCLIDIKTTKWPFWDAEWVYQVLGYVLLDWNNTYQIESVGIYFARQRFLLRWSLPDLLSTVSGGSATNRNDLNALRQEWHDLLLPEPIRPRDGRRWTPDDDEDDEAG